MINHVLIYNMKLASLQVLFFWERLIGINILQHRDLGSAIISLFATLALDLCPSNCLDDIAQLAVKIGISRLESLAANHQRRSKNDNFGPHLQGLNSLVNA